MIRRIVTAVRELRIAHHNKAANAHAAAMLAAQDRRDFDATARHWKRFEAHRSIRNTLAARAPAARPDPCCAGNCYQGRRACDCGVTP